MNAPYSIATNPHIFFYGAVWVTGDKLASDENPSAEHDAFAFGEKVAQEELDRIASLDGCRCCIQGIQYLNALLL